MLRHTFVGQENVAGLRRREVSKSSGKGEKRMEQSFSRRKRENIEQETEEL